MGRACVNLGEGGRRELRTGLRWEGRERGGTHLEDLGVNKKTILYYADRASLYNLVNKANLVHNFIPPCIPDSHPYRVTNTKCHIDTVISPDDGHIVARNTQRKEIYVLRKIVHQFGVIYKTGKQY
jgi:hypothetical protein